MPYPPAPVLQSQRYQLAKTPLSDWSIEKIRSLQITPDTFGPLVSELGQLGTRFLVDKIELIDRALTRPNGNGKAILVLGMCPKSNVSTGDLDNPSCCTEKRISALEIPGGPSVVHFDLRQDCIRCVREAGKERCLPITHCSEEERGIEFLVHEIKAATEFFGLEFESIFSYSSI